MESLAIDFDIIDSKLDEKKYHQATVEQTVKVLSELKAETIAKQITEPAIIITTDVAGELEGQFLGKPISLKQAQDMILSYSNKDVLVWCSTTIINTQDKSIKTHVERAVVEFSQLNESIVQQYVDEMKPIDKGGAIAIEEIEDRGFIKKITGEYEAIIGISMQFVKQYLKQQNVILL